MPIMIDDGLTAQLQSAHLSCAGEPPPDGFLLLVGQGEIIYVFCDHEDSRIADCPKCNLAGRGELPCLASMYVRGEWDDLAKWCERKFEWYCGILGIPRKTHFAIA